MLRVISWDARRPAIGMQSIKSYGTLVLHVDLHVHKSFLSQVPAGEFLRECWMLVCCRDTGTNYMPHACWSSRWAELGFSLQCVSDYWHSANPLLPARFLGRKHADASRLCLVYSLRVVRVLMQPQCSPSQDFPSDIQSNNIWVLQYRRQMRFDLFTYNCWVPGANPTEVPSCSQFFVVASVLFTR